RHSSRGWATDQMKAGRGPWDSGQATAADGPEGLAVDHVRQVAVGCTEGEGGADEKAEGHRPVPCFRLANAALAGVEEAGDRLRSQRPLPPQGAHGIAQADAELHIRCLLAGEAEELLDAAGLPAVGCEAFFLLAIHGPPTAVDRSPLSGAGRS